MSTGPASPTLLFQRLRWWRLRNSARALLQRSLLRIFTILICCLLLWGLLFYVGWRGFSELKHRWDFPLDGRLVELVFDMMFFALTGFLIFSTAMILHSSLFAAHESKFLLACPVPDDHIFAYKFQGAMAFSSLAFVLLGSPIFVAYGLVVRDGAPWHFYAVLPLFFLGFVLIPCSLGALIPLVLANIVPRRRRTLFWLLGFALAALLLFFGYRMVAYVSVDPVGSRGWFSNILGLISNLSSFLVPSHWIAAGLKAAALDDTVPTLYYLTLVWSNGLMLYVATTWIGGKLYRRGFNLHSTGGDIRKRYGGLWLDRALDRLLFFLDPQTRLLIVKDFRTFRRDPAQWLQITIFLGLAVLYFSNMRRFYAQEIGRPFQNGISLLTLTATSFLMCAYTGRFIFPMLSLEGRKFWILGLLPLERDRLLWGKFAFSATGCIVLSEFLVVFSDVMLQMPPAIIAIHMLTMAILSAALSGLSVGLGAMMPNFHESDPSKIAVGFGGTLNLVAGLLLLVAVIALMAGPFHMLLASSENWTTWWPWVSLVLGMTLGLVATILPLRAGARNLRGMEF